MNQIQRRPAARQDLVDIFRYYTREAGLGVARRFLAQAEATFARLADMPGMGSLYEPEEPLFAEIRFFPITRFKSYIAFYRPLPDGIEVLRILHGARDIHGILSREFGVGADEEGGSE